MEVYRNVVSDDLINETYEGALAPDAQTTVWTKDDPVNHSEIKPSKLHTALEEYLSSHAMETNAKHISYSYYIWKPGSNLQMHNDENYAFSATLYLNNVWKPDWGGLFVWEDNDTNDLKVICPKKNTLVVNNKHEKHMITQLMDWATEDRITIQIRGHNGI